MSPWSPPEPSAQLHFLHQLQRLLSDGQFTATYKFALLHAIADLCVEQGEEGSGAPLTLTTRDLARRFVRLYERQSRPYPTARGAAVLSQNHGRQAAVVRCLERASEGYAGAALPASVVEGVLPEVDRTIRVMPLGKLQTIGGGQEAFLYEVPASYTVREITLRPGVAYCFRAFHGLLVALIRDHWERWVRRANRVRLEDAADLHEFLFGSERAGLDGYRRVLREVAGGKCFYYPDTSLRKGGEVDHFIPWSRYPVDLGHNFVLACKSANSAKADHLASEDYLSRWLEFLVSHHEALRAGFERERLPHALEASLRIAEWSYEAVDRAGGLVWAGGKELRPLSGAWRGLIRGARGVLGVG